MEYTSGQLFTVILRGILTALMPFAAFWYLRNKHGGRFFPMFIGMITTMLILLPRALLRSIFVKGASSDTGKWLTVWLIGAVCEELGRYIAMKTALLNHDTLPDTVCYGLGHGGMETLTSARMDFGVMLAALTGTVSEEYRTMLSHQSILTFLGGVCGHIDNLVFHVMMSILIARAVHYERCKKLIPIAIFLHVLANFTEFCFGTAAGITLTGLICVYVYYQGKPYRDDGGLI